MIALWSYKLATRWRLWSAIHFVLRAWVCNPSLSGNFLQTPELNSVGTKTDVYLILLITHQKTFQVTKKWRNNRHAKHWSSSKQTSQATKRWKFSNLFIKKLRWPMVYIFLLKPFKAWIFVKIQFTCLTKFLNIQLSFLHGSKKNRLSLNFCFASFDSFKALTGWLEKLERLANWFGL